MLREREKETKKNILNLKVRPWEVKEFVTATELKVAVVVRLQFTVLNQLTFPVSHSKDINLYRRISQSLSRHLVRGILPGILDHHVFCVRPTNAYFQPAAEEWFSSYARRSYRFKSVHYLVNYH